MTTVRELVTRLGFKVDQASIDRADRATERVKDGAEKAASAFRTVLTAMGGFAVVQSIAQVADQMQSLRARIGELPQTVGDAGEALQTVGAKALEARQSVEAYAAFYIKAGNATQDFIKNQSDLLKIVDGAAYGLAASGASAVEQSQAFFQLGQAIGSPTVQMEEMNTLIDVAPDLFRALGKAIPGANGQLKAFIATGAVTGKMLAEGLMRVLPQFEARMRRMPMTISQAIMLIRGKWALFVERMDRESDAVTKVANFFLDAFEKIEAGLNWLVAKLGGAEKAVQLFGIAVATTATMLAAAFAPVIAGMLPVIAAIAVVSLAIQDLWIWVNGGKSAIGQLIGPWREWRSTVLGAVGMVLDYLHALWDVIRYVGRAFKALWDGDPKAYTAAIAKLFAALVPLGKAVAKLWLAAMQAAIYVIWKLYTGMWAVIARVVKTSMKAGWDNAYSAFTSFLAKIRAEFSGWVQSAAIEAAKIIPGGGLIAAGIMGVQKLVGPAQMTSKGMGGKGGIVVNNGDTHVNLSVPAGTPKEQQSSLAKAAKQVFDAEQRQRDARNMSAYAR